VIDMRPLFLALNALMPEPPVVEPRKPLMAPNFSSRLRDAVRAIDEAEGTLAGDDDPTWDGERRKALPGDRAMDRERE
jgi:hypothetical protein